MDKITAPFTPEQVEALNHYQEYTQFHPFTCGGADPDCERSQGEGEGLLKATPEGWTCPCGRYTQNWAHAFMTGKPINIEEQLKTLFDGKGTT